MSISKVIKETMKRSSWIRKMFEEGERMKAEGKPVYDFSLGNPDLDPPPAFKKEWSKLLKDTPPGQHRYMTNNGYPQVRTDIADYLHQEYQLAFNNQDIVMTCGAAGGLNVILKSLLDHDDQVIIFSPFFVEYKFYIGNHGGSTVVCPTDDNFNISLDNLEQVINPKVKALIINSPNNPTGVVYSQETLKELGAFLEKKGREYNHEIYLISDEPYRKLIFDMDRCPSILPHYDNSIIITSHSKDLGLAGERIGYVAISPLCANREEIFAAATFANRTLGFVNAPATMQKIVGKIQDASVDAEIYRKKRDKLLSSLRQAGYNCITPQGAFYLFPQVPVGDDIAFVKHLQSYRILTVPGSGFGRGGFFRIAFCVDDAVIEGSFPGFAEAIKTFSVQ